MRPAFSHKHSVPATIQSRAFKVAPYCARKETGEEDVEDDESAPLHASMRAVRKVQWENQGRQDTGGGMDVDGEKGN